MEQTFEKLKKRIEEILGKRAVCVQPIEQFLTWKDERTQSQHQTHPDGDGEVMHLGQFWGSMDGYLWLKARVKVPERRNGQKLVGVFDFNSIHEGYASGFESMLYVNGEPWQGVDENHKIVPLDAFAGTEIDLEFQLWAGITGGPKSLIYHQLKEAWLGYLDPGAEELALLAQMMLLQAQVFGWQDARSVLLLEMLEKSLCQVDWNAGDREAWLRSAGQAKQWLENEFKKYPQRDLFTVSCVGHTHIDLAWMWRVGHTKEKAARSFSTAMRLFEEFDEFCFYQSTPQLYAYIKETHPQLYRQIRERVREGRWEPGGAMWVEADCNLPGGESLVRQILYGKQFFKEEFGVDTRFVWLPDAFGFNFALPQILKKSGIDFFMTSKLSWNKQNRFPHDTFRWRGMDGSEVLGYFLTTPAGGFPTQEWAVTYNGDISPESFEGTFRLYQEKAWNRNVMMTYGHGDGGGGCTREMILKIAAMQKVPFAPKAEYAKPEAFFRNLENSLKDEKPLPVWEDELYLEYHRGTYTSQAFVKRANRKLEYRLQRLEYLMALTGMGYGKLKERLDICWKLLLKNQFHDILPGSSIHEVYEDARRDYEWLDMELASLEQQVTGAGEDEESYTVWNPGNWSRSCIVRLPKREGFCWTDEQEAPLFQTQGSAGTVLVRLSLLPPFGMQRLHLAKELTKTAKAQAMSAIDLQARRIENDSLSIRWNEQGQLTRVYDKVLDFDLFTDAPGNRLVVYEDKPLMFDAWDIDSFYKEKSWEPDLQQVSVVENNALRTILRFTYGFGESVIHQKLVLNKDSQGLVFETEADWRERQCLLKVYFPANVHTREAVFDTQFGNIRRSTTANTSVEAAKFEVCGHRFVDVSQRDRGLAIINDCKYGCDVSGSTVGLTLIKSAIDPDDRADLGVHTFTYEIYPHGKSWFDGGVQEEACALNNPAVVWPGTVLAQTPPLFELDGSYIEIDTIKPAEDADGIILRFHEYAGGDGRLWIKSDFKMKAWQECDLMEQPVGRLVEAACLESIVKPYEIKTYRIWMEE